MRQHREPGGRQLHGTRGALEQRHSDELFQLLDALPERGRAQRDHARSGTKVQRASGGIQTGERLERRKAHLADSIAKRNTGREQ
jgi:hypothetical protein